MDAHSNGLGRGTTPAMALALRSNFGSVGRWRAAVEAAARSLGEHGGRVLLALRSRDGVLVTLGVARDAPQPPELVPILVLDVPAQDGAAGLDGAGGVRVDGIDWGAVYARYQAAVHDASESLGALPQDVGEALLLDVRRDEVFAQAATRLPGSRWCDPADVSGWIGTLPADREIVVSCVYGHEVGRATALRLCAAGLRARFLRGGIDGWQQAGWPLARTGHAD